MGFKRRSSRRATSNRGFQRFTLRSGGRSAKNKRNPILRRIVGVFAAILVVAGALALAWIGLRWAGHQVFAGNDLFYLRPDQIKIKVNGRTFSREHVIEYAALGSVENLFSLNIEKARSDFLREVPQAKNITLSRKLPGTLCVDVVERMPLAKITCSSGSFLAIDRDGVVLALPSDLIAPAIIGHGIKPLMPGMSLATNRVISAVAFLDLCETAEWSDRIRVKTVDARKQDSLQITLTGGERFDFAWHGMFELGDNSQRNLKVKLQKMHKILRDAAARGKRVDHADLTVDRNVPVHYR